MRGRVFRSSLVVLLGALFLPSAAAEAQSPPRERLVPPISFVIPSTAYDQQRYEAGMLIARAWEKIGLKVEVKPVPNWPAFAKAVDDPWEHHAFMAAYLASPERLEPSLLLSTPFLGSMIGRAKTNYTGYSNPEYDRLLAQADATMDPGRRQALVHRAQEILAWDLPHVTLYHLRAPLAYNKERFTNAVPSATGGYFNFWNFLGAAPVSGPSVLKIGWAGDIPTLNPLAARYSVYYLQTVQMIYDTLARIGPDGKAVPWAAASWTAIDTTTVDVKLRAGMSFHDGRPVTAKDVAFTFQFFGKWKPAHYAAALKSLESVTAIDDATVRFKTGRPYAPLITLTFSSIPILPQHVWAGVVEREKVATPEQWARPNLVGSGPYRFVSLKPGQEVRLTRYDKHFSPPKTKDWLFIVYASQEAEFLALINKDLDFYDRGLTAVQYDEAKRLPFLHITEVPDVGVYWLQFNLRPKSPFHDHAFREALGHLIDYKTMISVFLRGLAEPGRGVIAPANRFWHNDAIPSGEAEGKPHYHQYDPERARAILKTAGYVWDGAGRLYYPDNFKPQPFRPR